VLLKSNTIFESKLSDTILGGKLSKTQLKLLEDLNNQKQFSNLIENIEMNEDKWLQVMEHANAENYIPDLGDGSDNETSKEMKRIIILKVLRPDRFISAVRHFVS
jgi:hypothetical protein